MITGYRYELWNGNKSIGYYYPLFPIHGTAICIYELPIMKQPYNKKTKTIKIPLIIRKVSDDGMDITYRRVLDVRKKSKRQIKIIKERNGL